MPAPDNTHREHGVGCGGVHNAVGTDADSVDGVSPVVVNRFGLLVNLTAVDAAPTPASIKRLNHACVFTPHIEDRAIRGIRGVAERGRMMVAASFPGSAADVDRV